MSLDILLIDDDVVVCKIHERLLKHTGFTQVPRIFNNGKSALEHILSENYPQKEYLILLDIHMPVMDGWAFLEELNSLPAGNFQVVVVSSSFLVQDSARALSYSTVEKYIVKPMDISSLKAIKVHVESLASLVDMKNTFSSN